MSPSSVILTTHGQTQWNVEGRVQGHINTPLNDYGHQMARLLRDRLLGQQITSIYTSDLRRAVETAEPFAAVAGLTIHRDARLRERRALSAVDTSEYPLLRHPRECETWDEVRIRMIEVMEDIARTNSGGRVLVVSHSGATLMFMNYLLEQTGHECSYERKKTAINELACEDGRWSIVSLNDDRHLERARTD